MIVGVITEEVEVGINIQATLPLKMTEKVLMVMGEVGIGLIPPPIPPIIQAILVYCWVFIFMVKR